MATSDPNEIATSQNEVRAETEQVLRGCKERVLQLESNLRKKDEETANDKKRIAQLEAELAEALKFKAKSLKESEEVVALKSQSDDTLTRAKSMLFEKTKIIKNQELQIEALNEQVSSMKQVITITKELLEIRNLEIKQLETKIRCMEEKVAAEKERQDLLHKKLETMIRHNGELKREYETQLCLFSSLREKYNQRDLAKGIVNDLKADLGKDDGAGPSQENGDDKKPEN